MNGWSRSALLLAVLALFGGLSLILGQTADWDLLNYHLYGPHAWLTGRWLIDVAPAQAQSFHNPLLHLPYYLGFIHLPHTLLAFLVGALQALAVLPLWYLGRKLLEPLHVHPLLIVALATMGLMGPMFLSELGRDFGDNWLALSILVALTMILTSDRLPMLVLAGLVGGAAVGLKLAFAFYLPALAAALLVMRWRTGVMWPLMILTISALAGLAATSGWWWYHLGVEYGNPLFPYFNDWFQSPWAPLASNRDLRFVSDTLAGQVLKPLTAMFDYQKVLELKFRDFRPAIMILTLLILPWVRLHDTEGLKLSRPLLAVVAFLLAAWPGWSMLFSYYRYTVVIEALLPITLLGLWLSVFRPGKAGLRALLGLLLLSQLLVKIPHWGRVDYGQLRVDLSGLTDADLLIAGGRAPVGWIALQLPESVPFIRVASNLHQPQDGTGLSAAAWQAINNHPGRLMVVTAHAEMLQVSTTLRQLGLYLNIHECASIMAQTLPSLDDRFWLCTVSRFNPDIVLVAGLRRTH